MKPVLWMASACCALAAVGCSGSDDESGAGPVEPLRGGSISAIFRDTPFIPAYAVAVAGGKTEDGSDAPDGMTIYLTTVGVGCPTDLGKHFVPSMYIEAEIDSRMPGDYADYFVVVHHRSESSLSAAGSSKGTLISITSVDPEVAGSISMSYEDPQGRTTAVSGDFVVARCFE